VLPNGCGRGLHLLGAAEGMIRRRSLQTNTPTRVSYYTRRPVNRVVIERALSEEVRVWVEEVRSFFEEELK
jgi:hypothetical protein